MTKQVARKNLSAVPLRPLAQGAVALPFESGDIIGGKFQIIKLLGEGGMGFVVSAMHLELGEAFALKFLRPEALANQDLVARFAREARAAVRIKSEYVARVFDVGNLPNGAPFIVMEHLDGKDLCDVLHAEGPLGIKRAVEYVLQACEALAAAHAGGIVHRDIKPENLFLTHRAEGMDIIKVLDFGISKVALTGSAFETDVPLVRTMMPMGSPVYMSPEQIRAWDDIDARTDIWSLGCVLFELLTGKSAFDAPSITQLSATILEQHPPPLRSLCPGAPAELEALVSRCLEKDRDKRFRNVAELAIALYPFGPRRARISAERCSFVLKSAGISQAEFELPSMPPPGWKDADSASAIPVENSPYRTSGPATMTMKDIPNFRGSSGSKRALFLGLGVALVAAGYAFARSHGSVASLASATAPPAAVTPAVVAPFAPTAENVPPPVGTGASIGTPEATATAARSAAATTATSKSKPSSPSPPTAKPKGPPPPTKPGGTTGKDELDVGF